VEPPEGTPTVLVEKNEGEEGQTITIVALTVSWKLFTSVFILIPRTYVLVQLSLIGSQFLMGADDYGELIMNGVALAFLIEIDNLMFYALISATSQRMVTNCRPLAMRVPRRNKFFQFLELPATLPNTVITFGVTGALIAMAYHGDRGKYAIGEALGCLCHAAGDRCISAQVLGGYSDLITAGEEEGWINGGTIGLAE